MLTSSTILRAITTSRTLFAGNKITGTVKWFNKTKGFGFISADQSFGKDSDIFVHQTSIVSSTGYRMLQDGQEVAFECRPDSTGRLQAYEVTMKDGLPVNSAHSGVNRSVE